MMESFTLMTHVYLRVVAFWLHLHQSIASYYVTTLSAKDDSPFWIFFMGLAYTSLT
jgi:hypothetical protein